MQLLIKTFTISILIMLAMPAFARGEGISLIRDCEIEDYLYQITKPIIEAANLNSEDIKIYIINDPSLNAFVSEGQNIFINTGLITKYKSPDVLIGVIAHETGHIASGHLARSTENLKASQNAMIFSYIAGIAAAIVKPDIGMAMIIGGSQITQRSALKFTRSQEEEADLLALKYLKKTKNSADGLLTLLQFFDREETGDDQPIDEYSQTHPISKKRINFIKSNLFNQNHSQNPTLQRELNKKLQKIIAKLDAFLGDPEQILKIYRKNDENSQYAKAIAYYKKGDREKASIIIDNLIKKEPQNGYFYDLKGQFLFEGGSVKDSIIAYNQAIKLNSGNDLARIALAGSIINLETGDKKLINFAINNLLTAQIKEKTNLDIYEKLSKAYYQNDNLGLSYLALSQLNLLKNDKDKTIKYVKLARENLSKEDKTNLLLLDDIEEFAKKIKEEPEVKT